MSWAAGRAMGTQTITVTPIGLTKGDYGRVRTPGTPYQVPGCLIQPLKGIKYASNETFTAETDFITTRYWLFAPLGTVLPATAEVTVPGIPLVLEVTGDPSQQNDLDGLPDHVEAYLTKTEG